MTEVGRRVTRKEDARLLRGAGRYVDDISVPGMCQPTFVRSPYAHADIVAVDMDEAGRSPGVVAAFSGPQLGDELPDVPCAAADTWPENRALSADRVRYVGEPVGMIVATSVKAALDAAETVVDDYEPLPIVLDPWEALEEGAPLVHPELGTNKCGEVHKVAGDPDTVFAEADLVVSREITIQRVSATPMEPRAVLAVPDPTTGGLTVWLSCQSPHMLRTWLAEILGLEEAQLRIIAPDVGGGFGSKIELYCDEVAVMWAALRTGRPVKWVESRSENYTSAVHSRDQIHRAELAVRADGTILGLRSHFVGDLGAYLHFFTPVVPDLTVDTITGNYRIDCVDIRLEKVYTNKMSLEPLRGSGRAEATFVLERLIEEAARELDVDPVEMRMVNLIRPDELPYRTFSDMTYTGGDYPALLGRAAELIGYDEKRRLQTVERIDGRRLGIGLATYNLVCGFSPSGHEWNPMKYFPGHEVALIRVDPHGTVTVYSGLSPHGQGSDTALAQIVADELHVPVDAIVVIHGDTLAVPYGGGTHGSRGAIVGGHAALMAAQRIVDKAKTVAAAMFEAPVGDIILDGDGLHVAGSPSPMLTWAEVAHEAHFLTRCGPKFEPGFEATAFYDPPSVNFSFGANAAVVEVDVETGAVRILEFVSVDDCGTEINPNIVDGQLHGGIAQGIGQALYEELVHSADGQVISADIGSYVLPAAPDVPRIVLDRMCTPSETPLGVRGVGESGALASTAAVVNAVADALAPLGVTIDRTPLRPGAVWEMLRGAKCADGA